MREQPASRPLYLGTGPSASFAIFHPPAADAPVRTPVLISPPWGWDEVASYRSRRSWAEHLAADGHPTLRLDLPGTGDSAGGAGDAELPARWAAALRNATSWLADTAGAKGVAVIGLGLGGLVAAQAIADGAPVQDLVLWATPTLGRTFLREQRAFGSMQRSLYGVDGDGGTDLPPGWQEIGGFLLSAETAAAIEPVDLTALDRGALRRVLLLERDGLPVDERLAASLRASGLDVTVQPGDGWGAMNFHPERPQPPYEVMRRVAEWLDAPRPGASTTMAEPSGARVPASDHLDLVVDGTSIRETTIHGEGGSFFGILAQPTNADGPAELCAVFLNAGAVRRTGPNRLWVESSRRWAARGISTVRVDVEGIGDADGDEAMYTDVGRFYTPNRGSQVSAILDALEARGLGRRYALIGLCAGAYSGFTVAPDEPRVERVIAINPRILVWDPDILRQRDAQDIGLVLDAGAWRRVLKGETSVGRVLEIARAAAVECSRVVRSGARTLLGRRDHAVAWADELLGTLDRISAAGTRLVLAFSGDEPQEDELAAVGVLERAGTWPNLVLRDLPGHDHTLRPISAQRAFHGLVDGELEGARSAPTPRSSGRSATRGRSEGTPALQPAER